MSYLRREWSFPRGTPPVTPNPPDTTGVGPSPGPWTVEGMTIWAPGSSPTEGPPRKHMIGSAMCAIEGDDEYTPAIIARQRVNARLMAAALVMGSLLDSVIAFSFEDARMKRGYEEALREWCALKRRARTVLAQAREE